jgi:hypothetical protein
MRQMLNFDKVFKYLESLQFLNFEGVSVFRFLQKELSLILVFTQDCHASEWLFLDRTHELPDLICESLRLNGSIYLVILHEEIVFDFLFIVLLK